MFDSHDEMLRAQKLENKSRSRRALCIAETSKITFEQALLSILLLEAWMYVVAAEMEDVLHKNPLLLRGFAVRKAIAYDRDQRRLRNPIEEFGVLGEH